MQNSFTKITRTGYGSRIGKSFSGVVIGLILFTVSFGVLFWNEGRQDVSEIAKTVVEIESNVVTNDVSLENSLISTSGELTSEEKLGDDYLRAGEYIAFKRTAEMFAWVEETEEETRTETGGSEVTETTYNYVKEWQENPSDSKNFEYAEDHNNPLKKIDNKSQTVNKANVGVYEIDPESIQMPEYSKISLNEENVILENELMKIENNYIFYGTGSIANPEVGDIRISYHAVQTGLNVTAFGKLNGAKVSAYTDEKNNKLYRLFEGTKDEAIATMHTEYVASIRIFRAVGFIMMWIGLTSVFTPLTTIIDVLPIFGKIGRGLASVISFIIALVLSGATIIVSMIVHNMVALIIIGAIVIALIIAVIMSIIKAKKNKPSVETPTQP